MCRIWNFKNTFEFKINILYIFLYTRRNYLQISSKCEISRHRSANQIPPIPMTSFYGFWLDDYIQSEAVSRNNVNRSRWENLNQRKARKISWTQNRTGLCIGKGTFSLFSFFYLAFEELNIAMKDAKYRNRRGLRTLSGSIELQ